MSRLASYAIQKQTTQVTQLHWKWVQSITKYRKINLGQNILQKPASTRQAKLLGFKFGFQRIWIDGLQLP